MSIPKGKSNSAIFNGGREPSTIMRTLDLPEIAPLRPRLMPELTVFGSTSDGTTETLVSGIADAVATDGAAEAGIANPKSKTSGKTLDLMVTPIKLPEAMAILFRYPGYIVITLTGPASRRSIASQPISLNPC